VSEPRVLCSDKYGRRVIRFVTACWAASLLAALLYGAEPPVPFVNSPPPASAAKVEVEQIDIGRFGAVPEAIVRPAGPFILLLRNETADQNASFVLDPGDAGEGKLSRTPVLLFDGHGPQVKRRRAGFLTLPPGQYHLKLASTDHILCTIALK
jgi:hypothetical protein